LLTCADIGLRNVGFRGIIGMVDLTQLFVLAAASLVIPFAFYSQAHVAVDLLTQRLGPRANAAVALASTVLGAALLGLLVVYGWNQAQMSLAAGDRSQTLELPVWLYWAPFLAGNAPLRLCRFGHGAAPSRASGHRARSLPASCRPGPAPGLTMSRVLS
jgi:TRAP-type C4-dicarboxylate transport system permease small subunit